MFLCACVRFFQISASVAEIFLRKVKVGARVKSRRWCKYGQRCGVPSEQRFRHVQRPHPPRSTALLSIVTTVASNRETSLEPGPSRARCFPREMLLLTTTARERAWRLLKITSPLIGWFDGDSPIPGISPWLAPLSRCTQYIVEVQRTLCSCLFVFEIRTVGWHQPCCFHEARRSRRCGV